MVKTTVMKVVICCKKCQQKLMLAVSRLQGIDVIEVDDASSTLTVTGNADPVDVIACTRKATESVVVVSIGPPRKLQEPQKKPEEEEEKKAQDAPATVLIQVPAMCHVCHHQVGVPEPEPEPEPSCSIM